MISIKTQLKMNPIDRKTDSGCSIYQATIAVQSISKLNSIIMNSSNTLGKWYEEDNWKDDNYRSIWINLYDRNTITYCEGDITMTESTNTKQFYKELSNQANYYSTL